MTTDPRFETLKRVAEAIGAPVIATGAGPQALDEWTAAIATIAQAHYRESLRLRIAQAEADDVRANLERELATSLAKVTV